MVTAHTYYLAGRERTFGERASDDALAALLVDTWHTRAAGIEPTLVDGVSAWLDDAGEVQIRVVKNATAETVRDETLSERIGARLRA